MNKTLTLHQRLSHTETNCVPANYPHRVPSANGLSRHIFVSRLPAANRRSAWLTALRNCPVCPVCPVMF